MLPVAWADEADDKRFARDFIGIAGWEWRAESYGTVMVADIVVTNTSPWAIKDIEFSCYLKAPSGTVIDRNTRTVYQVMPPGSVSLFTNVNLGLILDQTKSATLFIRDFEFTGAHPSRDQITQWLKDRRAQAVTNAAIAKAAAEKKKASNDASVLKLHQEMAAKGEPYGLWQLGKRYAAGAGVEKDIERARDLLSQAVAKGQESAKLDLALLPPPASTNSATAKK